MSSTISCSLPELVEHKQNGFIFSDFEELIQNMKYLLFRFPEGRTALFQELKKNIEKFRSLKWHDNWVFNISPIFSRN